MPLKVSIWDLDYYYTPPEKRKNLFNVDLMRISSYHKQRGDYVNFVQQDSDINRPFDLYYISKCSSKTPNPPGNFLLRDNIIWLGDCYKYKKQENLPSIIYACRPDYLLYPEKSTKEERSNYLCFFDNQAHLLKKKQDMINAKTNKYSMVSDRNFWLANDQDIISALKELKNYSNLSFQYPIDANRIIENEEIKTLFLQQHFIRGSLIKWLPVKLNNLSALLDLIGNLQKVYPDYIKFNEMRLQLDVVNYWRNQESALYDWKWCREAALLCKKQKAILKLEFEKRSNNPYFELFEVFAEWGNKFKSSWLEFITSYTTKISHRDYPFYWTKPGEWNDLFRDLLRQTWRHKEFLVWKWGETKLEENLVPYNIFQEEFKDNVW